MSLRQKVVWMEWEPKASLPTGGTFLPTKLDVEPEKVWTLFQFVHPGSPPHLPFFPVHRLNAFWEDVIHDWNWRAGTLRYFTRTMGRSVWILVEYKEEA